MRPWTIGDPGRSFTEVDAVLGDPLEAPDTVVDAGWFGRLAVRAASIRGLSHRQKGILRQDAYGIAASSDRRWLVVVVADGVSAGAYSHRAAQLVARRGAEMVAGLIKSDLLPDRSTWYDVFQQLAGRIVRTGQRDRDEDPATIAKAMATTVTFLVCAVEPRDGQRRVNVAWLGDSPVWSVQRDGRWHCLTEIKGAGNEVATSQVAALPYLPPGPEQLAVREILVDADAVLLAMTDGVGDPLGAGTGLVGQALRAAWRRPPPLLDFAVQVGFGRKGFDDDRTVVGIWDAIGPEE